MFGCRRIEKSMGTYVPWMYTKSERSTSEMAFENRPMKVSFLGGNHMSHQLYHATAHSRFFLKSTICFVLCWFLVPAPSLRAAFVDVYSIGNSLTVDLSAIVLDALTANEPDPLRVGFHAKCGSNLTSILADPTFCLASDKFGQFPTALANNRFDAITIQPFNGSTIRQEVEATRQIVSQLRANPNNVNTRVLIYATWSQNFPSPTFLDTWKSTGATLDSPFDPTEEVYQLFMNELRVTVPEAELLPVGHTFYALADDLQQGLLPGLSSFNDLYRDYIHASDAGRYIADLTAYAVIYDKSPVGLGYPSVFQQGSGPYISDATAGSRAAGCLGYGS